MKIARSIALFAVLSLPVFAVEVGQSLDQVIAEKGTPSTKLEAGDTVMLTYPDQRIKVKAGKVVEIKRVAGASVAAGATPPTAPAPAAKPAAPEKSAAPEKREASANWVTNYDAALARAKEQNAKVFLLFTGSDWCVWCMRLEKEILGTPEFAAYAGRNLVLVKLDFPENTPISAELKRQNETLAKKYGIRGFPTVVVLDSRGKRIGEMGYREGGPRPFIQELDKL